MKAWAKTIEELAAIIDCSIQTLYQLRNRHGAPLRKTRRGYNVKRLLEWCQSNHLPRRKYPGHHGEPVHKPTNGTRGEPTASPPSFQATDVSDSEFPLSHSSGEAVRLLNLQEQARERKAKATIREIELQKLKGELIPASEVKQRDIARIAVVKRGLLAFADSLPQHLEGRSATEMKAIIHHRVRLLLEKFANT